MCLLIAGMFESLRRVRYAMHRSVWCHHTLRPSRLDMQCVDGVRRVKTGVGSLAPILTMERRCARGIVPCEKPPPSPPIPVGLLP